LVKNRVHIRILFVFLCWNVNWKIILIKSLKSSIFSSELFEVVPIVFFSFWFALLIINLQFFGVILLSPQWFGHALNRRWLRFNFTQRWVRLFDRFLGLINLWFSFLIRLKYVLFVVIQKDVFIEIQDSLFLLTKQFVQVL
jgi:hypothetical protein